MAGNFNNPNPTAPGQAGSQNQSGQLPEHRMADLQKRLQAMEVQNAQLRGTLNAMGQTMNNQTPQAPEPDGQGFTPEVEQALKSFVSKNVNPMISDMKAKYETAIGNLYDQLDEAKFGLKYSGEKFEKYQDEINRIRQDAISQNRFVSREQALQLAFFEDTMRKPTPQPAVTAPQPQWDNNLGMYVHPGTTDQWIPGTPVRPAPEAPQNTQMPNQQMPNQQMPNQQMQQMPNQQMQQMPNPQQMLNQPQTQAPFFTPDLEQNPQTPQNNLQTPQNMMQNIQQQVPVLPDQTPNPSATFKDPSDINLDISSSEEQLDAWERKYGDVPL